MAMGIVKRRVPRNATNKNYCHLIKQAQFHGARRLADRNGWLWGVALCALLACCCLVIGQLIQRYLDSPTFLIQTRSVEEVRRFPSVIICPELVFPEHRQRAFLDRIEVPAGVTKSQVRGILQQLGAFYSPDVPYTTRDLTRLEYLLDFNEIDVETAVRDLMLSCEEALLRCRWRGELVNCSTLFTMTVTGDGFCCTFNARSLRREIRKHGVHGSVQPPVETIYTDMMGWQSGLFVVINQSQQHRDIDLSYKWVSMVQGQVYVDTALNGTALSPGHEHWIAYISRGLWLTDTARDLTARLRRCRISNTEPLTYFPIYGRRYCLLECEMAQTMRQCGCIKPTHPLPPGRTYCRAAMLSCSKHAAVSASASVQCRCPATCDGNSSSNFVSSFPLAPQTSFNDPIYEGLTFDNVSVIRAYMLTHKKKTFARLPYFSYVDLFSQVGGIFNVYFGCSVLTVLELMIIVYRALCHTATARNQRSAACGLRGNHLETYENTEQNIRN